MAELTPEGLRIADNLAGRYAVSRSAVLTLFEAVANGHGTQAQFFHPDLGGMGQWSKGGMVMVGDMFNQGLKNKVDNLCSEIAGLLRNQALFNPPAANQSQEQWQGQGLGFGQGGVSLFVPGASSSWWPAELGTPASVGSQNDLRYAYFSATRRLAIELSGQVRVYDTGDHSIGGFSQQQSGDQSLTFTSQFGLVRVADLPQVTPNVVSSETRQEPVPEASSPLPASPAITAAPEPAASETMITLAPEPAASETMITLAPEPAASETMITLAPEPAASETMITLAPEPAASETMITLAPEPAASETMITLAPEPAASETMITLAPEPAASETMITLAPEPAASEPLITAAPEPAASETLITAAPEPAAGEMATTAAPEPLVSETATTAAPEPLVSEMATTAAPEPAASETLITAAPEPAASETVLSPSASPMPAPTLPLHLPFRRHRARPRRGRRIRSMIL